MIDDIDNITPFNHKMDPLDHQKRVFIETREREYYALFWEMGVGKTKPEIDTMAWLYLKKKIDAVLVVSDKGNYLNWIREELPKHMTPDISYIDAYYSSSLKVRERKHMEHMIQLEPPTVLKILCVNIESLSSKNGNTVATKFVETHNCLMILDESTSIKNLKAKRTKAAIKLGRKCKYRRIMTGTPITQSPLDLFAQAEFLSKNLLGFSSFVAFRAMYAKMRDVILPGRRPFKQIIGWKNLDELTESIKPWSSRLLKSECLDLPDKVYQIHYVEQTKEQKQKYMEMKDLAVMILNDNVATATNALTAIMKLHQVNCGHVKDDDGNIHHIDSNRLSDLKDILDSINPDAKALIWCAFQEDVRQIHEMLMPRSVHYYGKTTDDERRTAVWRFQNDPDCRYFVGTPKTGGKGLTLTAATYVIYYSNTYNLEHRLQSEDRAHRIGQTNKVTYIDMIIPRTIDDVIVDALRTKKDLARVVLDDWRTLL